MPRDPAGLLQLYARAGRQLAKGLITPVEFGHKVLDLVAATPGMDTTIAPELVAVLPAEARPALRDAIAVVLRPEYRKGAWHYGGPRRRTESEMEAESAMLTARLKAWASALAHHLGDDPPAG